MTNVSLPLVLDAVAKASLILAATALVAAALRRASASARHFVWTLGLLSALAAPALSIALPRWEVPLVTIAAAVAERAEGTGQASYRGTDPRRQVFEVAPAGARLTTAAPPIREEPCFPSTPLTPWPALALMVWAISATVTDGAGEQAQAVQSPQAAQRPLEQYPGQAQQDNRANARKQNLVQDAIQGELQGRLQAASRAAFTAGLPGASPAGWREALRAVW